MPPRLLKVLTMRTDMVVAKLAAHPEPPPPNCALAAAAFFETSERLYRLVEQQIALSAGLAMTQASQFETRIWCLAHLATLLSQTGQTHGAGRRFLKAVGDCIVFEYLHGELAAGTFDACMQLLGERYDEHTNRLRDVGTGADPLGWFWQCLRSASSGAPRTANDALTLEDASESFSGQVQIGEATATFCAVMRPLFEGTSDFTRLEAVEFERRVKAAGVLPEA